MPYDDMKKRIKAHHLARRIIDGQIISEIQRKQREQDPENIERKRIANLRKEVHTTIQNMVREGKSKVEILTYLSNNYSDSNISKYFGTWIDYHFEKIKGLAVASKGDDER